MKQTVFLPLLVTICFIVVVSSPSLSVSALSSTQLSELQSKLTSYENLLNNSISTITNSLQNPTSTCSVQNVACNPPRHIPTINFSNYIPAEYAYVQPKEWIGQSYLNRMNQTCVLESMASKWLSNYNASNNTLLYQYFTYPDNFVGFYPQVQWNCASNYTPTERPFYVSGASGQKDMVILIDVSSRADNSAWRLATSKKIASQILRSLSYRDFVSVIAYGDVASRQVSQNTQATIANVKVLLDSLNNITLMPNNGTNVGDAIDYALTVLSNSKLQSLTSSCTQTIVLLSGGDNDQQVPLPGRTIVAKPEIVLFPFLVSNNITAERASFMRALACGTNSITRNITSDSETEITKWSDMIDYFAKLSGGANTLRWSEVYDDALSDNKILSLSAPVYSASDNSLAGVITLDASITGFNQNGNITIDDLNSYILGRQVCSPLNQHRSETSDIVVSLQNGMCSLPDVSSQLISLGFVTVSSSNPELSLAKSKLVIIAGASAGCLILATITIVFAFSFKKYSKGIRMNCVLAPSIVFLCSSALALAILFAGDVFNDFVKTQQWTKTILELDSITVVPERQCSSSCQSGCFSTAAPSCTDVVANLLRLPETDTSSTECNGGYSCCQKDFYDCNCREYCRRSSSGRERCYEYCDTCSDCKQSIADQKCVATCIEVYLITSSYRYMYQGKYLHVQERNDCRGSSNSVACKDKELKTRNENKNIEIWVDPSDEYHYTRDLNPSKDQFLFFLVFVGISGIGLVASYVTMCYLVCCRSDKNDDDDDDDSSGGEDGLYAKELEFRSTDRKSSQRWSSSSTPATSKKHFNYAANQNQQSKTSSSSTKKQVKIIEPGQQQSRSNMLLNDGGENRGSTVSFNNNTSSSQEKEEKQSTNTSSASTKNSNDSLSYSQM